MKPEALRNIVGLNPLPEKIPDLIKLVSYADANHVLGQMAHHSLGTPSKGLSQVFENAKLRARHDQTTLLFEMNRVERALSDADVEACVLKGGAYVAKNLAASKGRRVSDLDILVPADKLKIVEQKLKAFGWEPEETTDNEYDQQYYRTHMHELPPLRHKTRGTIIDIHHALLPTTAKYSVVVEELVGNSDPIGTGKLYCFDASGLFIHSAVHAFADGALDTPARTLIEQYFLFNDLTDLQKHELVHRAKLAGAQMPVGIALWFVGKLFRDDDARRLSSELVPIYRYIALKWMVQSKVNNNMFSVFGKAYLYLRSHYLRMPVYMLIPHLVKKALRWRPGSNLPPELPQP